MSFVEHRLGCDPDKLFPYEALQEQLRKFGLFAVAMGAMLLPSLTANQSDIPDLDEASEKGEANWFNPLENRKCLERMRDIIDDVVRMGLI